MTTSLAARLARPFRRWPFESDAAAAGAGGDFPDRVEEGFPALGRDELVGVVGAGEGVNCLDGVEAGNEVGRECVGQ